MIQEQYVSLEIARLLNEKGFDEPCFAYYSEFWDDWKTLKFWKKGRRNVPNKGYLNAPTQALVIKWLREIRDCIINVWYDSYGWNAERCYKSTGDGDFRFIGKYSSYEEACEAAIKYCLENLI